MDNTELNYVQVDPDALYQDMQLAYIDAGGDVLYPGDEKEMLLRAALAVIMRGLADVNNALRMDTLRYAIGEYLDVYGERRGCTRLPSRAATAGVRITLSASGRRGTIPAGTAVTADGSVTYTLNTALNYTGYAQTFDADVTCTEEGIVGNGLIAGTQMQMVNGIENVESITCIRSAAGGEDEEADDVYRERIRLYGLANVTTGPQAVYESKALAVSSVIIDAHAVQVSPGTVGIYLLLSSSTGASAIIDAVYAAVNAEDVRPLTDTVQVSQAVAIPYALKMQYTASEDSATVNAILAAVDEYKAWQERKIGRAFNPEMLMAMMYQAGATRVVIGSDSTFDGQTGVSYTDIAANKYCSGTIDLAVIA